LELGIIEISEGDKFFSGGAIDSQVVVECLQGDVVGGRHECGFVWKIRRLL